MISLIEKAINEKYKSNNIIYISFNGSSNVIKFHEDFIMWRDAVLKALKNGYTIKFLFNINNERYETSNFIKFAKPLIETGAFLIYYHKYYDASSLGREATIIPGIGALSCFSTSQNCEIDSAFYINTRAGIDILCDNFNAFLLSYSKPLLEYYTLDKNLVYANSLLESEERLGTSFLFNNSLNLLSLSKILPKKILKKLYAINDISIKELELCESNQNSFLFNLQYHDHFDIYTLFSIQNLIKNKQIEYTSFDKISTINLHTEDVIMILQNIIDLMKTYDNYNFALINETHYKSENTTISSLIIKEKHRVHIKFSKFNISIDEPMIVNSFVEYFKEAWELISPIDKNKEEIIKWLQHQIKVLEKQLV